MLDAYLQAKEPSRIGAIRSDWEALGQLFTDTVYSDRTSLLGGEPVTVGRAEFVDGWRQTLQNLDEVHHMITCHVITLDGDRAACSANMMGTHVYTNHSGGPIWTVGGRDVPPDAGTDQMVAARLSAEYRDRGDALHRVACRFHHQALESAPS